MIRPHKTKIYLTRWIFIIMMIVLSTDSVMAQNTASTAPASTETLSEMMFNFLGAILNILYMITLPVLVIAGKAIDNSLVYGEFINLDRPLYMLHQFARAFANFAIGWVLLWKVVQYIFTDRDGKTPDFIKGIVIKWVATVIAVNASWFGLWALLDLSTIATYSLGALPLGVLKESNKWSNMPILAVGTFFDFSSNKTNTTNTTAAPNLQQEPLYKQLANFSYYQRWNINISSCEVHKGIVIWPTYYPEVPNSTIKFDMFNIGKNSSASPNHYCALNSQVLVNIKPLQQWKYANLTAVTGNQSQNNAIVAILGKAVTQTGGSLTTEVWTEASSTQLTISEEGVKSLLLSGLRLADGSTNNKLYSGYANITQNAYHKSANTWSKDFMEQGNTPPYSSQGWLTLHTLINSSKGMVWPFVTLYMSLLDYSQLTYLNNWTAKNAELGALTEFLLKGAVSLALFIPLVALAVVLIIRVVLLRAIIAFIPLGIVFALLWKEVWLSWDGFSLWDTLGKVDAKWIIWLIFAPILPVFAISMSIIFLHTLQTNLSHALDDNSETRSFLGIQGVDSQGTNKSCIDYRWIQAICIDKWEEIWSGAGLSNYLPWLIVNMFAIGLMWMMIKFAFAGSQITSKIWESVMSAWWKLLWSIPVPGMWWIQAGSLLKSWWIINNTISDKFYDMENNQYREMEKLLNKDKWETDKAKVEFNKQIKWKTTANKSFENYAEIKRESIKKTYSGTEQTQRLEDFNNLGRATFGEQSSRIIDYIEDPIHKEELTKQLEKNPTDRIKYDIKQYMSWKDNATFRTDPTKLDSLANHLNTMIPEKARDVQKETILNITIPGTTTQLKEYIDLKDKKFVKKEDKQQINNDEEENKEE